MRPSTSLAVAAVLSCLGATAAAQLSFQGLGIPTGAESSDGAAISADGTTVGVSVRAPSTSVFPYYAYRWTRAGGLVSLNVPGNSIAGAVSKNGSVMAGLSSGFSSASGTPYRWTAAGAQEISLAGAGLVNGVATAMSADGSVIAGYGPNGPGSTAFKWTSAGGAVRLNPLAGQSYATVQAMTGDGSVLVGASRPTIFDDTATAVRWNGDTPESLGLMTGGTYSTATGVSSDGSIVVGSGDSSVGVRAFRWSPGDGMVRLGVLAGAVESAASAVSGDGSVVVGSSSGRAFLWTIDLGMLDLKEWATSRLHLDLEGWALASASDISADGTTIVGTGINPSGQTEGFVLTIPGPGAGALGGLGIVVGLRRRRR